MPQLSAGLLLYRHGDAGLEVLLVHPGGPFFRRRDDGSWSVPKGLVEGGEASLAAAKREFEEETGFAPPDGEYLDLGEVTQKGGKRVRAWACEGDCDPAALSSNRFEIEWPPHTGRRQSFPEVDRADFFPLALARERILEAQIPFLERLGACLGNGTAP